MKKRKGYRVVPFSANRRLVEASAGAGRKKNNVHLFAEVDVAEPRRLLEAHRARTGERLSFTAYVVACLARAIAEHPELNAMRRGRKVFLLDDVTVSVLVERRLDGERIPEPFGVHDAARKSLRQIHDEIRAKQQAADARLGGLEGLTWVRFIPGFLLRTFIRLAKRSPAMAMRYGVVSVTAVGMFGGGAMWGLPLVAATVGVTVGSIVDRPAVVDGRLVAREHLCLTVSFDHDLVDGAPAARFARRFAEVLSAGDVLRETLQARRSEARPSHAAPA